MAGGGATCDSLMDEARCAKLCMFTSTRLMDTPDRVEHVQRKNVPVSASCVPPDLNFLVQAIIHLVEKFLCPGRHQQCHERTGCHRSIPL